MLLILLSKSKADLSKSSSQGVVLFGVSMISGLFRNMEADFKYRTAILLKKTHLLRENADQALQYKG